MIPIDTVLIKVASRCNINCSYCYVYNMGDSGWAAMPKRISHETTLAVALALRDLSSAQQRPFAVTLHGGEPLLLGHAGLARLLETLRENVPLDYSVSIQTNGMLITDRILDICSEYRTTVSVSIDGPASVHDRSRVGHQGEPTHGQVIRGIGRLRDHPDSEFLYSGLLAVIDPRSDPQYVYEFLKGLGARSIDFLCRDGNHSRLPPGKASIESTEFGSWLAVLLDLYLADPRPPRVRLLDDILKLILGGRGAKEGIGITDFGILIIDTDGSVTKNDTLKSAFDGADRFEQPWSVHTHRLPEIVGSVDFARYHALQRATSSDCRSCPEYHVCGGGMPLHRWRDDNGFDNPSVYCADQILLINHARNRLNEFRISA